MACSTIFVYMIRSLKIVRISFLCMLILIVMDSCSHKTIGHNPYLDMKRKRPSVKQIRADERTMKKAERIMKRQIQDNKEYLYGTKKAPGEQ